jgi:hypothetical protein
VRLQLSLRRLLLLALVFCPLAQGRAETKRSARRAPTLAAKPAKREAAPGASWRVGAEMTGYADTDAVYVASPTLSLGVGDELVGWSVNARYLVDAVSAASVDVVTSASGKWTEYRHVGSLGVELPVGETKLALSGGVSREPDYLSVGGGGTISTDMMGKNLTPSLGVSYSRDQVGRTGEPHAFWRPMERLGGQLGATIVLGRSTIGALSLDGIAERGYLGKPYRYVPLLPPGGSLPVGASPDEVNRARIDQRPADAVPDARDRVAVTGRLAHRWDGATLRLDERVYRDSWGLLASTTDARVMVDLGRRVIVWPHVRAHVQNGVAFWQRTYQATAAADGSLGPPRYRTGDRELGPLQTFTVGLGLRWRISSDTSSPSTLFLQVDGGHTRFFDALYITRRLSLFSAVGIETEFD